MKSLLIVKLNKILLTVVSVFCWTHLIVWSQFLWLTNVLITQSSLAGFVRSILFYFSPIKKRLIVNPFNSMASREASLYSTIPIPFVSISHCSIYPQ